jgi:hypothetical protein
MSDLLKEVTRLLQENKLSSLMEQNKSEEDEGSIEKEFLGAQARTREFRLPPIFASEISVGQKPGSEERSAFQTWMQHIEGGTVDEKIKNIQAFFDSDVSSYTIAETLSHLMFLNSFVYIMKEFNPSVAGFLWEPLLAGLFGGEGGVGKQIPAGAEHDIADIRVYMANGEEVPYSLKVLSGGDVKGSFTDLANHFALRPDEPMIYEIIYKGSESTMEFYRFEINKETVWDILGGFKYVASIETEEQEFIMDPKAGDIAKVDGSIIQIKHGKKFSEKTGEVDEKGKELTNPVWKGHYLPIAKATYLTNAQKKDYAKKKKAAEAAGKEAPPIPREPRYLIKTNAAARKNIENIKLQPMGEEEKIAWDDDEILIGGRYKANLAIAGEKEGEVRSRHMATKTRRNASTVIWGEDLAFWERLHQTLGWQEFWEYVKHPEKGAPGVTEKEQFHIPIGQWRGAADPYATLVIDTPRVQEIFQKSAQRIGEDLTNMFEHLAELTDNIGRFFLSSCGSKKCSKAEAANRGQAGTEAKQNATDLQVSVNKSVEKMQDVEGPAPGTPEFKSGSEAGQDSMRAANRQAPGVGFQEHKITLTDLDSLIESMVKGIRKNKS